MKKNIVSLLSTLLIAAGLAAQTSTPPAAAPAKPFKVPPRHQFKLPNGLTANLVPYGNIPKAQVSVIVRSGNLNEGANQVWLADLTGDLMRELRESGVRVQEMEVMQPDLEEVFVQIMHAT